MMKGKKRRRTRRGFGSEHNTGARSLLTQVFLSSNLCSTQKRQSEKSTNQKGPSMSKGTNQKPKLKKGQTKKSTKNKNEKIFFFFFHLPNDFEMILNHF